MQEENDKFKALIAESQRLRFEFISIELEFAAAIMAIARTRIRRGNRELALEELDHVGKAIDGIHKFLSGITSPTQRASLADKLDQLETEALQLIKTADGAKRTSA